MSNIEHAKMPPLRFFAVALIPALAGCVPIPVYKTLQPQARVTVLDQARLPVADAEVHLISSAYPYGFERSREVQKTGTDGKARFTPRREWRVETLMLHGSEIYFWNWCVRSDGYATFLTSNGHAREFDENLVVQLVPGDSSPCPTRFH